MLFGAVMALLLAMVPCGTAFGPMTESEKKEARFFNCIRAMQYADQDGDMHLTDGEYAPFVKKLSWLMFEDDSVLEPGDELPEDLVKLYKVLVAKSGATSVDFGKVIDIYGASVERIGSVSEDRLEKLHSVCQIVMHGKPNLPVRLQLCPCVAWLGWVP
jgi:hypothetical protein